MGSEDFAKKVIDINQNYEEYQVKTENAFDAVMHKDENWEIESQKLENLYTN